MFGENVLNGAYGTGFALGLMAKDVRIAQSVIAASATDAPVLALADERWAKALGELGPAADQSRAHQSWWAGAREQYEPKRVILSSMSYVTSGGPVA